MTNLTGTLPDLNDRDLWVAMNALVQARSTFLVTGRTIRTTEAGSEILRGIFRLPTWDEWLDCISSVSHNRPYASWVNGHELVEHRVDVDPTERCWRIDYLAERREKYPHLIDTWERTGDFPEGLDHGPGCPNCKGTGVNPSILRDKITAHVTCRGCDLELPTIYDFRTSCCLAGDLGMSRAVVAELREEHVEDGHHFDIPACPLCAEGRMRAQAEARKNAAPALG